MLVCASTLVGVIVLRMVWVFISRFLLVRPGPDPATGQVPTWQGTFLVGWAGMRGVVTLAAAYVIPPDFEHREVLLLIAFTVVAGTLFLQGLTLPVLARMLDVPGPDPVDDALARATLLQQASKAGLKALEEMDVEDPHGVIDLVRQRIDQRNFSAWERLATTADEEAPSDLYSRVRRTMIDAERGRILEIRKSGTVPSEVVADVLAMLDVEESHAGDGQRGAREHPAPEPGPPSVRSGVRGPRAVPDRRRAPGDVLRGLRGRGHAVGGATPLPGVRQRRLLRLLAAAARHPSLPRDDARGHAVR